MEEVTKKQTEGTLEDLCQELLPLTVCAEETAQTSVQAMEVVESADTVEKVAERPNPPTENPTTDTRKPRKKMVGSTRGRYKALVGLGVKPEEALQLSVKSFAELKKMGYKFGGSQSKPGQKPVKRPRSEEESPQGNLPKNPRVSETPPTQATTQPQQAQAYSEVLSQIRVGIKDSSPMTDTQLGSLCYTILQKISTLKMAEGPKFLGYSYKPGWLLITCEDQRSKAWLEEMTPSLKPWPEANLRVIPENELPKPNIGMVFIPDLSDADVKMALSLLCAQNFGLYTEYWKILHTKVEKGGVMVTVAIDDQSVENLRKMDLKASLGFRKIQFRLKGTPKAQQPEPDTSPTPPPQNPSTTKDPNQTPARKVPPGPKRAVPPNPASNPVAGTSGTQRFPTNRGGNRGSNRSRGRGRGGRQGHANAQRRGK